MRIIEQINKQISLIERVERAKKQLSNLTIDWETDITKVDISKVHAGDYFVNTLLFKPLRIGKLSLNHYVEADPDVHFFTSRESTTRYLNLIELVATGEKIVPPLRETELTIRDGVTIAGDIRVIDGTHRQVLAFVLGEKEIPVVEGEVIRSYQFTPGNWLFDESDGVLTVKSLFDEKVYCFEKYTLISGNFKYIEINPIG